MQDLKFYYNELDANKYIFKSIFGIWNKSDCHWKQAEDKWSALQILCHLVDEEKEDFRFRIRFLMNNEGSQLPSINPVAWVEERKYSEQNFHEKLEEFILERNKSIQFLNSLNSEATYWNNKIEHQHFGTLTPRFFLKNWLAHDYLHIKQLTRLRYEFLEQSSREEIEYAGKWT